jgi:hypothetical protein
MRSIGKRAVVALTVTVWLAAAGSAAALGYELNRPLTFKVTTLPMEAAFATARAAEGAMESNSIPVLHLPTVTIVGRAAHRAIAPARPAQPTDISLMRCRDWQELQMGSGRVQVCE